MSINDNVPGPFSVLNAAIRTVPSLKPIIAIPGIAAALRIAAYFVPFLELFCLMILMLAVGPAAVGVAEMALPGLPAWQRPKNMSIENRLLRGSSYLLVIAIAGLLFTSIFFGWPRELHNVVSSYLAKPPKGDGGF